jgi:hypothetical protein
MKSKDNFSIIENSLDLKEFWNRYAKSNPFSKGLDYEKVIATIKELLFK